MKRFLKTHQGLTLIELVCGMAILSIGILALINCFGMTSWGLSTSQCRMTATQIAQQQLELTKSLQSSELDRRMFNGFYPREESFIINGRTYMATTTVTRNNFQTQNVIVHVAWQDRNVDQQLELYTLLVSR